MNISEDIPVEYNALVLEHFERPRNAGRFADDLDTIDGVAGSVAQGAMFRLSAHIAQQRIAALRFEAYGCPHCLAAGSWLSERLLGATCEDLQSWQWREAAEVLEVPAEKRGRLLILEDAVRDLAAAWAARSYHNDRPA